MHYRTIRQARKTLTIRIEEGEVVVRAPFFLSEARIEAFVCKHERWIEERLDRAKEYERFYYLFGKRYERGEEVEAILRQKAQEYIPKRVEELAKNFDKKPKSVKITSAKKRWGSCSGKGNLNFSYRCAMLPKECIDYVIVHELCHLVHHNHSKAFWELVAHHMPDYKDKERLIRNF